MSLKKKWLVAVSVITFFVILLFNATTSNATFTTDSKAFKITRTRNGFGYSIGVGEINSVKELWSIVDVNSPKHIDNTYCLAQGAGFAIENPNLTYTGYYNMLADRVATNTELGKVKALTGNTDPVYSTDSTAYSKVLSVLDMAYAPEYEADGTTLTTASKSYKDALIQDVMDKGYLVSANTNVTEADADSITVSDFEGYVNDELIVAMQQSAVWYFSNNMDETSVDACWIGLYNETMSKYLALNAGGTSGEARNICARALYKYLIDQAKANYTKYADITETQSPITVNDTKPSIEKSGSNYIVGKFNITQNSQVPYTINAIVKNGDTQITNYKILDSNKQEVASGTTLKNLIGKDFYISVPVSADITKINVSFNTEYSKTTMKAYFENAVSNSHTEQPIAMISKTPTTVNTNFEFTPDKYFDLALRKYITSVEGKALTDTRAPSIDLTALSSGTTAKYAHKKDPVAVSTGNTVAYNITVYNEGEKAGRATKVVDQLPTGLTFSKVTSSNYTASYDETTNQVTFTKTGTDNLAAYTSGTLDSETISIECTVTQTATTTSKILTNVAWISEEYDAVDNKTITSTKGEDRDSEPATVPTVNKDSMDNYIGNNSNKTDLTDKTYFYKGEQDDDDFEKLILAPETGVYNLKILKVDNKDATTVLSGAVFNVTLPDKTTKSYTTKTDGSIDISDIALTELGTDTITIEETQAPKNYDKLIGKLTLEITKQDNSGKIIVSNVKITDDAQSGAASATVSNNLVIATIKDQKSVYDLALRKFITKINNVAPKTSREPVVSNLDKLKSGTVTTATYTHPKDALEVSKGDTVLYTLRIYNEGLSDGKAEEITDYLPTGLQLKENSTVNTKYGWTSSTDSYGTKIKTTYLKDTVINAFDTSKSTLALDYKDVEVECTVVADPNKTDVSLKNIAEITKDDGDDRDSTPDNVKTTNYGEKSQEDDDDFEPLVLKPFDLALIKRITAVNKKDVQERIQKIDVSSLNRETSSTTTAKYTLNKEAVLVNSGDIVKYTFRIYNEGYQDGYASLIKEDIPEGLAFLYSEKTGTELENDATLTTEEKEAIKYNQDMLWKYSDSTLKYIETNYLSKDVSTDNLITAFGSNDGTKTADDLKYKEVSVMLKVKAANASGNIIKNEACIAANTDKNGNNITDRDSSPDKWVKYEDDEDYDNIRLQSFDLALRKFIVAVSHDGVIDNSDYLKNSDGSYTRAPVVDTSKLNKTGTDGKIITTSTYNHTKEPVEVTVNDTVVYTLRVYNEGEINGYAAEIKDHLPPYLQFVESDLNNQYGWKVSEDGRTVTTSYLKDKLINAAKTGDDGTTKLSYEDVQIMCKVTNQVQSNYKVTNLADITKYEDENHKSVNDRDSIENNVKVPTDTEFPTYKDNEKGTYIPGQEDDDDFEKVIVKIFDLALRKWVTQAIVIEDGNQTVTETGHQPYDDPENIVKVEINRKKTKSTTVKFRFSIRVYNQGDIAGYAKEVKDYIPDGLEMEESENPQWVNAGNNVIVTNALENKLLQPGDYADVDVLLTWINSDNNIGSVMDNIAEISKDYNDKGIPDIDSVPDNNKSGEDDIDDAPVLVSISTGRAVMYLGLGFTVLVTMAGGVILIKKYVL